MPTPAPSPVGSDPAPAAPRHSLAPPTSGPVRRRQLTLAGALAMVGSVACGAFVAFLGARARDGGAWSTLPFVILASVVAVWLQALIHEAGHALAALVRGYRPVAFGVGPLRLENTQAGWL